MNLIETPVLPSSSPFTQNRSTDLVQLSKICKNYDEFVAVDHLSLSIPPGGIYGLLKPNGAGKTSTIRMIIGMIVPDCGQILCLWPAAQPCASP